MPFLRNFWLRLWLVVATIIGGCTALVFLFPDSAPNWTESLLIPAMIGSVFVGGVHGGAAPWVLLAAMSIGSGVIWASLITLAIWLISEIRRIRARTPTA